MPRRFRTGVVACAFVAQSLLGLSACSVLPTGSPSGLHSGSPTTAPARSSLAMTSAFELSARFSLVAEGKSHSGRLSWRHSPSGDVWLLSSPFGQGVAEIVSDASGARLTTASGQHESDSDLDALTRRVLGYALPLGGLADWLGDATSPVLGAESGALDTRDAQGRPQHLVRDGWFIDFSYDGDDAQAAPSRVFIVRPGGPELRLRIDEWRLPEPAAAGLSRVDVPVSPVDLRGVFAARPGFGGA